MDENTRQLEAAMAALEAQRALLGSAVVDTALLAMKQQLASRGASGKASAAAPDRQLRQVSVLFVDVVGSTAIGQRLAPEDISAVMDGALECFTAVVQKHHGRVLQYTGDGMLAAFGTEAAHEDDAEAAVLAGLGIVDAARRFGPQIRARHAVADFNVRAGIHTGRVLLGGGVDAEGSIRGSAVNLAARMEQTAPPGRLRISHDTYRHVSGVFDVVEQTPVHVKGIDEPVRGYLVECVKPRAFRMPTRGIEGVTTPMVGRDAELALLLGAFESVCARRSLRTVVVVGDAGLGKSRLIAEFSQALDRQSRSFWLLPGRAQPRSALHPYRLLHDLLAWHLQITDDDSAAEARRKLVDGLTPLFADDGDAPVHVLGHLVGMDFSASPHLQDLLGDEAQLRERGFAAAALCLARLGEAKGAPVVVLLDDVHWADAGSLDFAHHLLQHQRRLPLLCVLLTRPTLFETDERWAQIGGLDDAEGAGDFRVDLKPLDRDDSQHLADLLLHRLADVPDALRALVTAQAEGNPFYMEELVKMLLDDGVIVAGAEGWRVLPDRLMIARVPQTLTGVLQARLDALAPAERLALQHAAIVGHLFSEPALTAIDPVSTEQLRSLVRKQLVRPAAQLFGDTREYAFSHQLLQQVAYDGVLRDARREGHARVGAYWCDRAEISATQEVDPAACRALAEAHDHCRQADPKAFIGWFDRQFSHYLTAYVGRVLMPLARSVLALAEAHCGPDDVETGRALTNVARAVLLQSETGPAEPLLRRALAIQQQALGADHPDTARTFAVLGGYYQGRGDLRAAEPLFRRAFDIRARALGAEHPLTLGTLDNLAHAVTELGRFDEAEMLCRRALDAHRRSLGPDDPAVANTMNALGDVLVRKGDAGTAEPLIREALALQRRSLHAQHPDIGLTLWHLAQAVAAQGRPAEAELLTRDALEIWEAMLGSEHEYNAWGLMSLAEVRLAQDDAAEAAGLAERALKIYERLFGPEHAQVAATLIVLARALEMLGDAGTAAPLLGRALAIQQLDATAA